MGGEEPYSILPNNFKIPSSNTHSYPGIRSSYVIVYHPSPPPPSVPPLLLPSPPPPSGIMLSDPRWKLLEAYKGSHSCYLSGSSLSQVRREYQKTASGNSYRKHSLVLPPLPFPSVYQKRDQHTVNESLRGVRMYVGRQEV